MTHLIERQLRALGDAIPAPVVALDDDLARGRRRVRRHRLAAVGATALVSAAVVGAALSLPAGTTPDPDRGAGPAGAPATPAPAVAQDAVARILRDGGLEVGGLSWDDTLGYALADGSGPVRSYTVLASVGRPGTGRSWPLEVRVAASLYDVQAECGAGCDTVDVEGRPAWRTHESGRDNRLVYEQLDGDVVAVTLTDLGRHAGLVTPDLVEALLTSPDLRLDGDPASPRALRGEEVDAIGRDVLTGDVRVTEPSDDLRPATTARVDGTEITWDAAPVVLHSFISCSDAGRPVEGAEGTCDTREVGGVTLRTYEEAAGPFAGWLWVEYDGPVRRTRVFMAPRGDRWAAPMTEVVELLTDPRWQR